ncbi:MAG: TerB family tellurite resistance protein [Octadecabacter sp.]|nr:TerB family tellurite resistance protein [Octadecabacter sp.]
MTRIASIIALTLGLTAATTAHAGAAGRGNDLRFVAETTVPAQGSTETMSLCHLVDVMDVLYVPVYSRIEGYALSPTGCTGDTYQALTLEQLAQFQAVGMISSDIPLVPSTDFKSLIWGHMWLVLIGFGLLARGIGLIASARKPRGDKAPDPLAIHALVAMSQVAVADGGIDAAEVRQIAAILTRLTGTSYSPEQVVDMLNQLNPTHNDLEQVGLDLSDADRQIVLEAALNIAVADGEIHATEYAVVSELAERMRIGADQFRSALGRISAHLQTIQPTG